MSALKGAAIESFLSKRDPAIHAVLIYGPDNGLVRERANIIALQTISDFKDPFNYIELADIDLKETPSRLSDEASALSFAGGERVVRLRVQGEAASKPITQFLTDLDKEFIAINAIIIIEAGDLGPRSALRKAFEKAKRAAALPCYSDGPAQIRQLITDMTSAEDLRIDRDAMELLLATLGEDRGLTRSELEKLVLYKGLKGQERTSDEITVDDVQAILVDGVGDAQDLAASACCDGAPTALATALSKAASAGSSPIGLLRALQRQFSRLLQAQQLMNEGASPSEAMKKLRPPIFFKEQRAFETRLRQWSLPRIEKALDMLIETELDAKRTGAPQRDLVERTALRLAHMGRAGRR